MTQTPRKIGYDERTISDESWAVKHNTQHFHIPSKCYFLLCYAVLNAFYCYKEVKSPELWKDNCIHENIGLPVSSICNIIGGKDLKSHRPKSGCVGENMDILLV